MTTIDLQSTLEQLRAEKYPELDAELVKEIISIQANFMDGSPEGYKQINKAIENFLVKHFEDNHA